MSQKAALFKQNNKLWQRMGRKNPGVRTMLIELLIASKRAKAHSRKTHENRRDARPLTFVTRWPTMRQRPLAQQRRSFQRFLPQGCRIRERRLPLNCRSNN
jgi:hypothetical protein